ncbi:MAG: glycosyltransferase family 4 protein [Candidatus Obscuribacterales bacterium]|nr:glycosyltransferase family 4 protein [Candidatus Obscuribacterales bacterium]
MPKRVLMLSWEYPPRIIGGLARVVAELSKQLSKSGVEVHVVTADHPGCPEHEIEHGVHIHRVKTQTDPTPDFLTWVSRLNIGLIQYAIEIHRKTPFDIIHAHDWMVCDAAWALKKGFGLPLVATMHATEAGRMKGIHTDLQRYINQIEWRLTFEAWKVIVNSNHMAHELTNQFSVPQSKICLIPNGIDPELFDFNLQDAQALRNQYATDSQKIVLFVGRMVLEKGVQVLLNAAPSILAECPGTKFLMVGTGYYLDDLKRQAQHLHIDHDVRFLGYVSDPSLLQLYKIADVVCIPSLYEPFGIVALEGMAAKVPVVTSDAGGLTDFVEHMANGVTTYADNVQSLTWGILQVLRNPELAEALKHEAYERVSKIYNWQMISKRTLELYEEVLKEATKLGPDGVAATPKVSLIKTKNK